MIGKLLASFILLGLCVVIHSAGIALILRQIHHHPPVPTWRTLGPVEGLTGTLMCGFSTGIFFAISRWVLRSRMLRS